MINEHHQQEFEVRLSGGRDHQEGTQYPVFLLLGQASEPLSGSLTISGKDLEVVFQWQTAYSSLAWAVGTKLSPNLKVTKMV